ncbi:MAG: GNAT family N-acetyltransferase [Leptolyngbyaceae cyanobacterium MO_188.B28]|nr:GNAT family N-acetyltransferase [Leptolyngbyaceae cyanobacterium MO_188.B28]
MEFIDIDRENWEAVVSLSEPEDKYIYPNLYSIAEAQFYEKAMSKAISVDGVLVGYAMYGENEDDSHVFWIDRFMIGKRYRRNGYGGAALLKLLEMGASMGYERIETSTESENEPMRQLLSKCGFRTNNEIRYDEVVYYYPY